MSLPDNSFQVHIGFTNNHHITDIFGRNRIFEISLFAEHFDKKLMEVYSKLTFVNDENCLQNSKDSWIFSLIHKLFMTGEHSLGR